MNTLLVAQITTDNAAALTITAVLLLFVTITAYTKGRPQLMCTHTGPFDGPLTCDRTDTHDETATTGHTYSSTSAGDAEPGGDY